MMSFWRQREGSMSVYRDGMGEGATKRDARFDAPLMTAQEAGVHLGIAPTTIKQWLRLAPEGGVPVMHSVPPPTAHGPRIPFIALAEAQILRELRNTGLSMQAIRAGVAKLRKDAGEEYVLATRTIASDGGELLYNAATKVAPEWVRARDGQGNLRQVVDNLLKYVHYAPDGFADRLVLKPYGAADVIVDPRFAFGQPVLQRNKIRIETIADIFYAGESVETIAGEFDLDVNEVEAIIRVVGRRAA
jgi:uncharacterized protein (DUF433 family)